MSIESLVSFLESNLSGPEVFRDVERLREAGGTNRGAGREGIFCSEFLEPALIKYFQSRDFSSEQIEEGLGTEGFQTVDGFGYTPARKKPHFFRKSDIVNSEPPKEWFKSSEKPLPNFQACPDFAIRSPLPFNILGEAKFCTSKSKSGMIKELYNALRQAVFYLGAYANDYDGVLLVLADGSGGLLHESLDDLHPALLSRLGPDTRIYLAICGSR